MKPFFLSIILLISCLQEICKADDLTSKIIKDHWDKEESQKLLTSYSLKGYLGKEGTKNYYYHFKNNKGTSSSPLFILTGAEDPMPLWFFSISKLLKSSFKDIFLIEIRGQGQSERVPDNQDHLIHLNHIKNYYHDLNLALLDVYKEFPHLNKNSHFLVHSTGSLVLLNSIKLISQSIPNFRIKKIVHWAPLLKLKFGPLIANPLTVSLISLFESLYSKCCGTFIARKYKKGSFKKNRQTSDLKKFKYLQKIKYDYALGSKGLSLRYVSLRIAKACSSALLTRLCVSVGSASLRRDINLSILNVLSIS